MFALVLLAVIGAGFVMVQRAKPVIVAVTTAAVMALVCAWAAPLWNAQPWAPPQPQPQPQPQPPYPQPVSPYDQPQPQPQPMPAYPVPQPPPAATPAPANDSRFAGYEVGALMGWATPLNRKEGQVAPLAGPSISIGAMLKDGLGIWIDFDSMGTADASHGTLLVSGSATSRMSNGIEVGGRIGAGTTLVNFDEPAFRDVAGATVRAEGIATYPLNEHWVLSIRPISFDLLTNDNLGGPILSWQVRIGLAYRFGGTRRAAADPAAGPPPPPPPPVALGGQP
jgi:hypothetical protein